MEKNYEIQEYAPSPFEIEGNTVPVHSAEITSCNILGAQAGTTGYRGGDSGHGCRTLLRLTNLGCTDMRLNFQSEPLSKTDITRDETGRISGRDIECNDIVLVFGGDAELDTVIAALEFMVKSLKQQTGKQ